MTTISTRSIPLMPLTIPLAQLSKSMSPQSSMMSSSHDRTKTRSQSCDNMDEMSESRSSPISSIQNSENYPKDLLDDDEDADNEIDRISCCSDDSELSVGKEDDLERANNKISENSLLSERRSSMDTTVTEDISNDSISLINRSLRSASSPQSDSNLIRFPIVRPSPTRFQEEFLRSSQLYAEELMKQQMSIVAAARGLPLTSTSAPATAAAISQKFGFRPHIKSPNAAATTNLALPPHLDHESLNFRGIHSHLNAISQITQNLSNISKITAATSIDSRENSQSPPANNSSNTNNNLHHHGHHSHHLNHNHHHHHHHHQLNLNNNINNLNLHNNNLNDSNLKFSIDNILKADFGRRITEPLKRTSKSSSLSHKRNHKKNNNSNSNNNNNSSNSNNNNNNNEINNSSSSSGINNNNNNSLHLAPIDLTSAQDKLSDNLNRVSTGSVNSINSNNNNNESVEDIPSSTSSTSSQSTTNNNSDGPMVWPAWVYCTRYSDRPSSGPRTRRPKKPPGEKITADEKRPRTAFSGPQLARLKHEFNENRYLTERRRQQLSSELGLNEAQIKIWFQNKRAKIKKSSGQKNPLALQLMAQGLYNHSTVPLTREEEELQQLQEQAGNV